MKLPRSRMLIVLPLLLLTVVLALAWSTLSLKPLVPHPGELSDADVRQIEQLIADNSPDRFQSYGQRELSLDARELSLLTTFMLANVPRLQSMAAVYELEGDTGRAQLSVPGSLGPLTLYLNLQAEFAQQQGRARLISLHAGRVQVPRRVMRITERLAGRRLISTSTVHQDIAQLRHNVNATAISNGQLHLQLTWEPQALSQLRSQAQHMFLSPDDRERLIDYYSLISSIASQQAAERRVVSLQAFVPALFELAGQRSVNGDAVAENRNLLQALSLYVNDLPLSQLVGDLPDDVLFSPPPLIVTMHRRHDLSLHFVTAAAIAASAGANIAEVLAHSKEVYDARQRTGFSFSDMTANISGVALGEAATMHDDTARSIQKAMAAARAETDYMPVPRTDADGLTEEMLAEAFGDRTDERFTGRITEIELLVAALPVYQAVVTDKQAQY